MINNYNKKVKTPLVTALNKHSHSDPISYHVPGHKSGYLYIQDRNILKYYEGITKIDQTELSDLDDLHMPNGVIQEAEQLLSDLYRTKKSFFLVNGSTVGNLAMILAAFQEGDYVLVQRNSHQSIMNGLELANVKPIFISPFFDEVRKVPGGVGYNEVEKALKQYPNIKGIILTYPNYYGQTYDIKAIIELAHALQIPVLVDEAHGAHFIIGEPFPNSSIELGADIVIHSAHKTLPALTMGSYLHFNSSILRLERVNYYLRMLQSSSPSYPIMASLDVARAYLESFTEQDIIYLKTQITFFIEEINKSEFIKVIESKDIEVDILKITLQSNDGITGFQLQRELEKQGIFSELADLYNVLLVFPLLKDKIPYPIEASIKKIRDAGQSLSKVTVGSKYSKSKIAYTEISLSELNISYKMLNKLSTSPVSFNISVGKIAMENIIPYPPGIPILLKGELIQPFHIGQILTLQEAGSRFHGGDYLNEGKILVAEVDQV